MNLKLSTWTPSMLLKTRYKNLTRFIFVFPCGPSICMARFISIHPEFIFQSDGYQFIGIFWKVSEMAKVFRKPRVIYLCIHTILENVITWKILDYAKANWIFSIDFMLWNQLSEIKSSNKNLNVDTMNILSNWIQIFGTSRSFKGISILALYHPCSVHEKQTAL